MTCFLLVWLKNKHLCIHVCHVGGVGGRVDKSVGGCFFFFFWGGGGSSPFAWHFNGS